MKKDVVYLIVGGAAFGFLMYMMSRHNPSAKASKALAKST